MKVLLLVCLLVMYAPYSLAQDTTQVLSTRMFSSLQRMSLSELPGWVYHAGHNPTWAKPILKTTDWAKRGPGSLSIKDADSVGRVDGWFRLRIRLDSTFMGMPIWLHKSSWVAADLYVDGRLLASFGQTGIGPKSYQEHNPYITPSIAVKLAPLRDHLIAIHVVETVSPFSSKRLKSEIETKNGLSKLLWLAGPKLPTSEAEAAKITPIAATLWVSVSLIISLLLWLLSAQKLDEQAVIRLLAIQSSFTTIYCLGNTLELVDTPFVLEVVAYRLGSLSLQMAVVYLPIIMLRLVDHPLVRRFNLPLVVVTIGTYGLAMLTGVDLFIAIPITLSVLVLLYGLVSSWKRLAGSQWAIVVGLTVALLAALITIFTYIITPFNNLLILYATLYLLSIPLSFLVYIVVRFREIVTEARTKAATVLQVTEEKRQILATQNERLEEQVEQRTAQLKASQAQLIQKEKLASLGELTAGIAHEIQNPLNFVNNFSEVSSELVEEQKAALSNGDIQEAQLIADDLASNLHKIHHHGGRASGIVKGMLEHSRTSTGDRQPTDLNALANEYLRLAYHGARANDEDFICELVTHFDPSIGQINVIPQEIGRVLLNLFSNAFYAVRERQQQADSTYQPTITITTTKTKEDIQIRIADNGTGMSERVQAKIFQPFFTTKPTGEGTGLGLSLSYDIITKGHNGSLQVESQLGEGTEFIIGLSS